MGNRYGVTGLFEVQEYDALIMAEAELLGPKEVEVSNLARRMGVDRFVQTDRFSPIKGLMDAWAKSAMDADSLTRETTWIDVRQQIEDIMVGMSLESNSQQELFLLGQTGGPTDEVNFNEVKQAFASGFNTLMTQYAFIISNLSQYQIGSLNRLKDKAMKAIPAYGTLSGKQDAAMMSSNALSEIESKIVNFRASAEKQYARKQIGERETGRTIMLAQSESGLTSGKLTQAEYDEILQLIGRRGSLFEEQLDAVSNFSGNLDDIFMQMDRTITAASNILQQISSNSLQGASISRSLGMTNTGQTGDGFRTNDWRFTGKSHMAQVVGKGVPNMISADPRAYSLTEGPSGTPWIGALESQLRPPTQKTLALEVDTSFLPSHRQKDPRLASKEGYWAMSGSRHNAVSKRMANQKMAGLGGMGATINLGEDVQLKTKWYTDLAMIGIGGYAAIAIIRSLSQEKTLRNDSLLKFGVHPKQTKSKKNTAKIQRQNRTESSTTV